ncbi:MAG: MFS transporter [Dehalococcoidia bacterium]
MPNLTNSSNKIILPFKNRNFRCLWLSNMFTVNGQTAQMTLLAWFILEETNSSFLVALIGTFSFAPSFMFGTLGGYLADKVNRRTLLVIVQFVTVLSSVIFMILFFQDLVESWYVYMVVFIAGFSWALEFSSRRAINHDLFGDSLVTSAIALDGFGMQFSRMLAPAITGILISLLSIEGSYFIIPLFYFLSLFCIFLIKFDENIKIKSTDDQLGSFNILKMIKNIFNDIVLGVKYVNNHKRIKSVILITVFMNLLFYPYLQIVPVIARDVLLVDADLMGFLLAAAGVGGLIGSIFLAGFGPDYKFKGRIYICGSLLGTCSLLLFSFSESYILSVILMLLIGVGASGFGVMQTTIVMILSDKERRGIALGIVTVAIGCLPFGFLFTGIIATIHTPSFSLGLNAVIGSILIILISISTRSLWDKIERHNKN